MGDPACVGEVPGERGVGEGRRREAHDRHAADDHQGDSDDQVDTLVVDPPWRDALVDDVGLLEEQLPRSDRRAHDANDQQHHGRQRCSVGDARHHEVVCYLPDRRVHHEEEGDEQEGSDDQHQAESLEAPEAPRAYCADDGHCSDDHRGDLGQSQVGHRQRDADELGDDGQRIQHEQVDDAECAPELAEALEDEPGVSDAGDGAEAEHHFLADVQHGDQKAQSPHEVRAEVLAGLAVGREGAGVVVADHDDEPRPHDREQGLELERQPRAGCRVAVGDRAQGAVDVADVGIVEDGDVPARWCEVGEVLHCGLLVRGERFFDRRMPGRESADGRGRVLRLDL